ncbi:MAG: DUF4325 domain-containing protein [Anaerolineae bacterium]|nr:DUF4325 domain-containing protein [Anaerolineae bacterium]
MNAIKIELEIVKLVNDLNLEGDFLVGRLDGKLFATNLQTILEEYSRNGIVIIDFAGVELMDGSFSDEVFGMLAAARGRNQVELPAYVLRSLNSVSLDNLEQALLSRPVREPGLRNCVVVVLFENKLSLVGKIEDHVKQTFELLNECGELNTKVVSEKLELSIGAASTRLKVLFDLGLAVRNEIRDEQGKQFVYFRLM